MRPVINKINVKLIYLSLLSRLIFSVRCFHRFHKFYHSHTWKTNILGRLIHETDRYIIRKVERMVDTCFPIDDLDVHSKFMEKWRVSFGFLEHYLNKECNCIHEHNK